MIVRSGQPFTLRDFFDRFCVLRSLVSDIAGCSAVDLRDRPDRFSPFCPDCGEHTAHDRFDELGVGWYAQIFHCQRCGRQRIRVWSLA